MSQRRGFTLIELLVVIAIIAILAAILFPVFARARAKAQQNNCLSNVKQLTLSGVMYCTDYDDYYPITYYSTTINGSPFEQHWSGELYPYLKNVQIYACPAGTDVPTLLTSTGYGIGPFVNTADYYMNDCLGGHFGCCGPGCSNLQGGSYPIKQGLVLQPARLIMITATSSSGNFYKANPDTAASYLTGSDPTIQASYNPTYEWPGIETRHQNGGNVGYCDGHASYLTAPTLYNLATPQVYQWNNMP
jgi:prepilin-type N-terminal cleavage/methylation domain-containing protein/prepilin-type processing-associated H-X9-DG protein